MRLPIWIYFHVYPINEFQEIVDEIMGAMKSSGLIDAAVKKELCVVRKPGIHTISYDPTFTLNPLKHNGTEWPTLQRMYRDCLAVEEEALVCYVHTKGVWRLHRGGMNHFPKAIVEWRKMMTYFVIERWKDVVDLFESDSEILAAGCNLKNKKPRRPAKRQELIDAGIDINNLWHFKGNFWWSRASVIRNLPEPYSQKAKHISTHRGYKLRLQSERWIGTVGHEHMRSLHQSKVENSTRRYPREAYVGKAFQCQV